MNPEPASPRFDFDAAYRLYPRKSGKAKGLEACKARITKRSDFDALMAACEQLAELWEGTDAQQRQFLPYWSTFINQAGWRDEELPKPRNTRGDAGMSAREILDWGREP